MGRKMFLLAAMILIAANLSYAGELIAKEAVNYFNDGVKAQKEKDFAKADSFYQKALTVDPKNKAWQKFTMNNYAVMYLENGDTEKAEAIFNDILKIDPDYKPAQLNLGLIYDRQCDKLKALQYWMKAFNIDIEKLKPKDFVIEEKQKQ